MSFMDLVLKAFSGKEIAREEKAKELFENDEHGIRFTKDKKTGQYRWFGIYSSNYLDDDYPADIISADAHKGFIERVEKGEVPYPELWHAHTKGTQWGETDWLYYDDETGLAYASGLVNTGHEKEAEALANYGKGNLGMSHGMQRESLKRDPVNKEVITQYVSYEISDLPLRWAANGMTALSFSETNISKDMEDSMAISETKKQYLTDAGLSEEQISELETLGKQQAEANADRPRKEKPADEIQEGEEKEGTEETAPTEDHAKESETAEGEQGEETPAEKGAEEDADEPEDGDTEKEGETDLTREEIVEVLGKGLEELGTVVAEALEKLNARIDNLEKVEKERVEKEKEQMLAPGISGILQKISTVGSQEAEISADDPLLKDGPKETEFNKESFKDGREFVAETIGNLFKQ